MRLDPKSPRQISHPEDLFMLCRSSKDGIVIGLENWNTPEGNTSRGFDKYGDPLQATFTADLEYLHVAAARETWVEFRDWTYDSQSCRDVPYRCTMEQFERPGFRGDAVAAYALTLDWYAPKGWKPALMMLAACADE